MQGPAAGVPVAEPGAAGDGGLSVAAIIGIVVAALIVVVAAVLLTTRRRRGHTFQRDAWGLPINPVVRMPYPAACMVGMHVSTTDVFRRSSAGCMHMHKLHAYNLCV